MDMPFFIASSSIFNAKRTGNPKSCTCLSKRMLFFKFDEFAITIILSG